MLTVALAVAAFVAGLTGAWSPCGFSMVSTLGEHARGRRATFLACAAFVPGALVGGVVTFGSLALVGSMLGGGDVALVVAAAVAAVAALAEIAGVRIAPQIRRQVPEHWRRVLPLPVAAAGYGVLLGLGFTTFVLTFAVWALAGVALAVGDVWTGVLIGLAFAAGRCVPVVVLAPFAQAPLGLRATELMAERPSILRGFRVADALALVLCAVALTAEAAQAQATQNRVFVEAASDPTVAGDEIAWKRPGGPAVLWRPAETVDLAAERVAIGGTKIAVKVGEEVRVSERATGALVGTIPSLGTDAVAVSDVAVVVRRGRRIQAQVYGAPGPVTVARAPGDATLGRPAIDGARVVYALSGRRSSFIREYDLTTRSTRTLRSDTRRQLTNPSLAGERLLYVETTPYQQSLVLGTRTGRRGRTLLEIAPAIRADKGYSTKHGLHRPGIPRPKRPAKEGPRGTTTTLWTTALAADAAYVTRLKQRGSAVTAVLLRIGL